MSPEGGAVGQEGAGRCSKRSWAELSFLAQLLRT